MLPSQNGLAEHRQGRLHLLAHLLQTRGDLVRRVWWRRRLWLPSIPGRVLVEGHSRRRFGRTSASRVALVHAARDTILHAWHADVGPLRKVLEHAYHSAVSRSVAGQIADPPNDHGRGVTCADEGVLDHHLLLLWWQGAQTRGSVGLNRVVGEERLNFRVGSRRPAKRRGTNSSSRLIHGHRILCRDAREGLLHREVFGHEGFLVKTTTRGLPHVHHRALAATRPRRPASGR
mmetsp:Transcript_45774/g.121406  ORF Transcript_45774/g.121406 Transcript_45774/m.121406 type:complete len:232 (+) Transcript_45774:1408-2103(+)